MTDWELILGQIGGIIGYLLVFGTLVYIAHRLQRDFWKKQRDFWKKQLIWVKQRVYAFLKKKN